jgi:type I restriction enzyme M protein
MSRISQQQLESYLWGAATLLRGTIDAGDYKQFIFPLLFYKRLCDVYDEETRIALAESYGDKEFASFPENHRFQIPPDAHWIETRKVAKNVGAALQNALRAIETANPDKLYGIFGDAQWTNKDRLPDAMLRDLIEHFSSLELTIANLPEDELGNGYEYLIKKFADDSGHTAAEFYTNRTVVHLMTELLQPQPGESVYDPTCGSGGMPRSCVAHLRRQGKEWRNVRIYGQERNLMTSSIARMNCFLHGIEDFRIERGDTLAEPKFVEGDRLQQFDVVLANPPYSIKQWDREAFASDPWGRNIFGTPPQGRADYAFWQHIIQSMNPKTGRCAILFPHGVLFRQEEAEMRRKLVEADMIECVIGLGPNLFYNSSMEACIIICRAEKPELRRKKILFINALNEFARERTQSFLTNNHIERIVNAYENYHSETGFAYIATLDEVCKKNEHSLKIDLYAPANATSDNTHSQQDSSLSVAIQAWAESRTEVRAAISLITGDTTLKPTTVLEVNPDVLAGLMNSFDRSKWTRVRFGDVVRITKEQVDPESGEVERYIAGEHMDSNNVHLLRWGIIGDGYLGPAFYRRFHKGQILYGSRRTYLKKVAMAEFDGVTANTTFVLEAVEGKLLPDLLPWLMLSEQFTQHSIRESKGSTNPYINFPDIAKYEFALPPLDQQRRISEIIWAIDDTIVKSQYLLDSLASYEEAIVTSRISGGGKLGALISAQVDVETNGWVISSGQKLLDKGILVTLKDGNHGEQYPRSHEFTNEGTPYIAASHISEEGTIDFVSCPKLPASVKNRLRIPPAKGGDILLTHNATVGRVAIIPDDIPEVIVSTSTTYYRTNPKILSNRYLAAYFRTHLFQKQLHRVMKQSTRDQVPITAQKKLFFVVPPQEFQQEFVLEIERIQSLIAQYRQHIQGLKNVLASMCDNVGVL